jgi:hypothetical protein
MPDLHKAMHKATAQSAQSPCIYIHPYVVGRGMCACVQCAPRVHVVRARRNSLMCGIRRVSYRGGEGKLSTTNVRKPGAPIHSRDSSASSFFGTRPRSSRTNREQPPIEDHYSRVRGRGRDALTTSCGLAFDLISAHGYQRAAPKKRAAPPRSSKSAGSPCL